MWAPIRALEPSCGSQPQKQATPVAKQSAIAKASVQASAKKVNPTNIPAARPPEAEPAEKPPAAEEPVQ